MSDRILTFVLYGVAGGLLVLVEIAGRLRPMRIVAPTKLLSTVAARPWKPVVVVIWMWFGWHLFAR